MALDEAHEMCINKDMKAAVTHPTHGYLQKTSLFFNYRIKAFKNLVQMLFPEKSDKFMNSNMITDGTPYAKHSEENIQKIIDVNKLVSIQEGNRGLVNVLSGQVATPEQTVDMLSFRDTGIQAFRQYVTTRIIQRPSHTNAPIRHQKLLTMSTTKENDTKRTRSQASYQMFKASLTMVQCKQNVL